MKYYFIFPILLPLIFICINYMMVNSIDQKVIYTDINIKYVDLNSLNKNVGLRISENKWSTRVFFYDNNNNFYERNYFGIVHGIYARIYYSKIMKKAPSTITAYIFNNPLNIKGDYREKEINYFNLNMGKDKSLLYYVDILNSIKYKYRIIFLISFIISIAFLLFIGETKTSNFYFSMVITDIILFVLYLLL